MKLHADKPDALSVTAYGDGWIAVNGQRHTGSLILNASGTLRAWGVNRFETLSAVDFDNLVADGAPPPELVLFGSGRRLRFVHPALVQGLMDRRIGVETMDTAAACRTYNILAGEGRRVIAALLIEAAERT